MAADTTDLSYWLNWRFFLCFGFLLVTMSYASYLIWKHEGYRKSNPERQDQHENVVGHLFKDEAWKTCVKGIHPAWLLVFRIISFVIMLSLITANTVVDGGSIFYFYTQWTFALVTIYFALGSSISIYGCLEHQNELHDDLANHEDIDTEQANSILPSLEDPESSSDLSKDQVLAVKPHRRQTADAWGYLFQIVFQTSAGAVFLTDIVFWFILYPFLTPKDFSLGFFDACMHSVNAILLLGDTALNCLRFPVFRFAYFILWTGIFVMFQWIIHACVSMWWPYPFLDLSPPYAPLWYIGVGILHIFCYGLFAAIIKLKYFFLSKSTRNSYNGL